MKYVFVVVLLVLGGAAGALGSIVVYRWTHNMFQTQRLMPGKAVFSMAPGSVARTLASRADLRITGEGVRAPAGTSPHPFLPGRHIPRRTAAPRQRDGRETHALTPSLERVARGREPQEVTPCTPCQL